MTIIHSRPAPLSQPDGETMENLAGLMCLCLTSVGRGEQPVQVISHPSGVPAIETDGIAIYLNGHDAVDNRHYAGKWVIEVSTLSPHPDVPGGTPSHETAIIDAADDPVTAIARAVSYQAEWAIESAVDHWGT